jgi:hypothetical protein
MSPDELEFFAEVKALLHTAVVADIEYRIYYNPLGEIVACSMINDDTLTGSYLVVTQEQYEHYFDYCVVNGGLKKIDHDAGYRVKLQKSNCGHCVVKDHAGLVLETDETHPTTEYYAHRNN